MEKYAEAIDDYTSMINIDKYDIDAYMNRAYIFGKQKNYKSAIDDYNMIIKIDENNTSAIRNREIVMKEQENTGKNGDLSN